MHNIQKEIQTTHLDTCQSSELFIFPLNFLI